jgi:hypothetical protein
VTRIRRTARGLGVLALAVPLSGAGVLLAAAPAYAGGGITAPGAGVVYDRDTTVRIRADITGTTKVDLKLKSPAPGAAAQVVDSGQGTLTNNNASLAYDLDTSCADFPSPSCSGRAPAVNGTWTITLSGGATDSSTFVLRIPPRAPSGLTARADGYRAVVLTWRKGDEPDLTGWTLYDGDAVAQDGIGTDACSGASCSTTVTYATDGTGDHTYALTSHRSVSPGSTDTLESSRSSSAGATLGSPPPPPSEPASGGSAAGGSSGGSASGSSSTGGSPAGGGSTGGGTGGSSSGGSAKGGTTGAKSSGSSNAIGTGKAPATIAQRRAFALTFKAFAPKLGIPKLPPLPATPAVAPLPDGTYGKTLGYKEVVKTTKVTTPRAAARRVTGAVGSALDSSQLVRSIAGALVLLLAAAHLRRWLGSSTND